MCAKSSQLLGPLGETSIRDLGIGAVRKSKRDDAPQQPVGGSSPVDNHPPLVAVSPDMSTLLALDHMLTLGVSGAPVVTSGGEMVANLSISDLRCGMGVEIYECGGQLRKFVEVWHGQVLRLELAITLINLLEAANMLAADVTESLLPLCDLPSPHAHADESVLST